MLSLDIDIIRWAKKALNYNSKISTMEFIENT
jgi:hypothetical protein